ncbi:unnamed protein product [Amoebophrya sp. A120]|nr:unnamed protein product [Amoebophrya sp. A120]|eukprot:GSA120T00000466001.1
MLDPFHAQANYSDESDLQGKLERKAASKGGAVPEPARAGASETMRPSPGAENCEHQGRHGSSCSLGRGTIGTTANNVSSSLQRDLRCGDELQSGLQMGNKSSLGRMKNAVRPELHSENSYDNSEGEYSSDSARHLGLGNDPTDDFASDGSYRREHMLGGNPPGGFLASGGADSDGTPVSNCGGGGGGASREDSFSRRSRGEFKMVTGRGSRASASSSSSRGRVPAAPGLDLHSGTATAFKNLKINKGRASTSASRAAASQVAEASLVGSKNSISVRRELGRGAGKRPSSRRSGRWRCSLLQDGDDDDEEALCSSKRAKKRPSSAGRGFILAPGLEDPDSGREQCCTDEEEEEQRFGGRSHGDINAATPSAVSSSAEPMYYENGGRRHDQLPNDGLATSGVGNPGGSSVTSGVPRRAPASSYLASSGASAGSCDSESFHICGTESTPGTEQSSLFADPFGRGSRPFASKKKGAAASSTLGGNFQSKKAFAQGTKLGAMGGKSSDSLFGAAGPLGPHAGLQLLGGVVHQPDYGLFHDTSSYQGGYYKNMQNAASGEIVVPDRYPNPGFLNAVTSLQPVGHDTVDLPFRSSLMLGYVTEPENRSKEQEQFCTRIQTTPVPVLRTTAFGALEFYTSGKFEKATGGAQCTTSVQYFSYRMWYLATFGKMLQYMYKNTYQLQFAAQEEIRVKQNKDGPTETPWGKGSKMKFEQEMCDCTGEELDKEKWKEVKLYLKKWRNENDAYRAGFHPLQKALLSGKDLNAMQELDQRSGQNMKKSPVLQEVIENNLCKSAIRRLARRGGVKRIGSGVYHPIRLMFQSWLEKTVEQLWILTKFQGRTTVRPAEVINALKLQGRNIYGHGATRGT